MRKSRQIDNDPLAQPSELLVVDEHRAGIEILELHGGPGYDDERLTLENGLSNGLRFLVMDNDAWAHFHIHSPKTAKLIAERLLQYAKRIADPPDPPQR